MRTVAKLNIKHLARFCTEEVHLKRMILIKMMMMMMLMMMRIILLIKINKRRALSQFDWRFQKFILYLLSLFKKKTMEKFKNK